ncbi:MAG: hypothetical protein ACC645_13930, partial [Pirellulales bacterium]
QSFQVIGTPVGDLWSHYASTGLPDGVYLRWERMLIGVGVAGSDRFDKAICSRRGGSVGSVLECSRCHTRCAKKRVDAGLASVLQIDLAEGRFDQSICGIV